MKSNLEILEVKNIVIEMKQSLEGFNRQFEQAENNQHTYGQIYLNNPVWEAEREKYEEKQVPVGQH